MPKRTSAAKEQLKVALITLDGHLSAAADRAFASLEKQAPGLHCTMHCAGEWAANPHQLATCLDDIADAHILIVCMLFMEDHINPVLPALKARQDNCDAMLCFMSAGEVMQLTRLGGFSMSGKQTGPIALLKKLRGSKKDAGSSSGAKQVAMLRRLPKILRFIPGTAQDVRAYFLAMQYWLAGSEENIKSLVSLLISRYAADDRESFRGRMRTQAPVEYPEVGLYHPSLKKRVTTRLADLPTAKQEKGVVGLLVMRSYILAANTAHYDAVIEALESRGLTVITAFASGLDARPAVEQFFMDGESSRIDTMISLTSFSLVGGPAYNDASAAEELMTALDVPYIAAHGTEFQSLESWEASGSGLLPLETTLMVAIPELDGATGPTLFAGHSEAAADPRDMQPHLERIDHMARRAAALVSLRRSDRAKRKLAVVLFNFPPNGGSVGSAAFLGVYESLYNTLKRLSAEGYSVEVPASAEALKDALLGGNASDIGTEANVHHRIPVDDHVQRETWLDEIEEAWGPAPGRQLTDGASLHVLGRKFGNVFVGIQPGFGYEGDPMRMLFESGLAPTHAFSAFYRYLREDFAADAVLHFGTHGALEFMPGKQSGMSASCWPDRLIGDLPNFYLYAANNPSEGALAKRRSYATLISYLTPPVTKAGLYRELTELKSSIERWHSLSASDVKERRTLLELIRTQAEEIDLECRADSDDAWVAGLASKLKEVEQTLIPFGMHVVGEPVSRQTRREWLSSVAESLSGVALSERSLRALEDAGDGMPEIKGLDPDQVEELLHVSHHLSHDAELDAIVNALDTGFVPPVAGGDLLRTTDILPTGRNIHSFDPYRLPSRHALATGAQQADELIERYRLDNGGLPESVAIVLWGTDNMKTEGGPIAQALRLMGARPRFDSYGRLAGAELLSLEELGRPRVDAVMTLSGIFRDLLPNQTRLLAEAALLAASADEDPSRNFVRKHALAYMEETGCDLETAALRVFSNANGAYGSNVNSLVDSGDWDDDDALAEQYSRRKCFAYGVDGEPQRQSELLQQTLGDVNLSYQNLESAELGITTIDHYFDTLGGISRAVQRVKGESVEVYIGDQTSDGNTIRTLKEQVALETRTRMLNPKWYEGMLQHGYEGVRQIESHITNTMGWSATTGKVDPWVYQQISDTFVLDDEMRRRLASLNPAASAKLASRLLEAHERDYWSPDPATLEALERAGEELEDVLEGVSEVAAA